MENWTYSGDTNPEYMEFDGWKADRKQTGGELSGYINAKYLKIGV